MPHQYCPITGHPLPDGFRIHPTLVTKVKAYLRDIRELYEHALDAAGGLTHPNPPSEVHGAPRSRINYPLIEKLYLHERSLASIACALSGRTPKTVREATQLIEANGPVFAQREDAQHWFKQVEDMKIVIETALGSARPRKLSNPSEVALNYEHRMSLVNAIAIYNHLNERQITDSTRRTMQMRKFIPVGDGAKVSLRELAVAHARVRQWEKRDAPEDA